MAITHLYFILQPTKKRLDRVIINYDAKKGVRSTYLQKGKHGQEVLQSVLHNGVPGKFEWLKDIYNALGEIIHQVVKK